MKKATWLIIPLVVGILISINYVACDSRNNDDDSNEDIIDNNDDDESNSDNDAGDDDVLDDDSPSGDDTDNPGVPECEEDANTMPELILVELIVNGEIVEQPYTATTEDEISIHFEYSDAECNIDCLPDLPEPMFCGRLYITADKRDKENLSEEAWDQLHFHTWLLPGIGCSSEEAGPYDIQLDPQDWVVNENDIREYPFLVSITDGCGASSGSENNSIDFTVHAAK